MSGKHAMTQDGTQMKMKMKTTLLGLVCLALLGGPTIAAADIIYDWTWTTTGTGPSALGTLDVNGSGQAVSGSGTVAGGGLLVPESFTLLTSGAQPYFLPNGSGFNWDTTVNSSSPYLTTAGLLFLSSGLDKGFNPYSGGTSGWQVFMSGTGLPNGGVDGGTVYDGTFTLTAEPVPRPAALPLLLSGLAALGAMGRRRKLAKLALA
jgi:hypothetical protein